MTTCANDDDDDDNNNVAEELQEENESMREYNYILFVCLFFSISLRLILIDWYSFTGIH